MILSFFSMDDSPPACSMVGCCHTSLSIAGRYSDLAQGDPDCLGDRVALDLPDTMGNSMERAKTRRFTDDGGPGDLDHVVPASVKFQSHFDDVFRALVYGVDGLRSLTCS